MRGKLFLLLGVILALIYWQWFLPGARVASDFSLISDSTLKSLLDFPRVWSEKGAEGLGEYGAFTLWSWPVNVTVGILANLGLTFDFLERVIFIIPILGMAILGIWKLCQSLNLSLEAKSVAAFIYLANTYILLLIDGGQLSIALSYAFLPIAFLAIQKAVAGGLKEKIFSGLAVSILGFFDFRIIFLLLILSLLYFLYEFLFLNPTKRVSWLFKGFLTGLSVVLIVIGIHAYWLLSLYKVPLPSQIYQQLINTQTAGFVNIGHSLTLLSPHWFKNVFGNISPLRWEFILLPFLVFLGPILKPKSKMIGFWLIVAIISIFLTKGSNPPFGKIYDWLFTNIPGFSFFRDSTKFFFLLGLSYSFLVGATVDELLKRFNFVKSFKTLFLSILFFYFALLIKPVWQGMMTGTFSSPPMQEEYFQLGQTIQKNDKFLRIFWIPAVAPLGYSDPKHPWVEAARLYQRRSFAKGVNGTYELFNFLREAPFMGEIFDISGIGYIVYPPLDPKRDNLDPDNIKYYYTFSNQLSKLPWLSKVDQSPIPLWKVSSHQDKFFITSDVWWVVGSDEIYKESTKSAKLSLNKNAMIFAEETAGEGRKLDNLPNAKISLFKKTKLDLAASFLEAKDLIFPSLKLKYSPDQNGWWKRETKDLISFRDFLKNKYAVELLDFDLGGGWAVGEGNSNLEIKNEKIKKGEILLARVLESTRSGQLSFYQGSNLMNKLDTNKEENVRWFEAGEIPGDIQSLSIQSSGDINIINALAIIDKVKWDSYKNKASNLLDSGRVLDFNEKNTQTSQAEISYQQINPSQYKISINKLSKPSFLIFSESFHPLWKINGETSYPIYNLLNGFKIEKDGQYMVEFEPQKYVYPGLIISTLTILTAIFLLFKSR